MTLVFQFRLLYFNMLELREKIQNHIKKKGSLKHLPKSLKNEVEEADLWPHITYQEKLFALKTGIMTRPTCVVCGGSVSLGKHGYRRTCSLRCSNNDPNKITKINATFKKNGGHPMTRVDIIEKVKETNNIRYGADWGLSTGNVKNKRVQSNLEKYGVENVSSVPEIQNKIIQSRHSQFKNVKLPSRLSNIHNTGVQALFDIEEYKDVKTEYQWKCFCGVEFQHSLVDGCIPDCPKCKSTSKPERAVWQMLEELGVSFIHRDRTQIKPRELDFYIPSRHLAIEINGVWFHHDNTDKLSLMRKTAMFSGELLHFWDFEVTEKPAVVKQIIKAKLGLLPKVGARTLVVKEVPKMAAKEFFNEHHLQGAAHAKFTIGLYAGDELLMAASIGRARFQQNAWELIRLASANIQVQGGASKLLKAVRDRCKGVLVSFADRRISNGGVYERLGFRKIHITRPGYFYVKGKNRLQRLQAQKHKLAEKLQVFDASLSEYENMKLNGWLRCSDCGHIKYELLLE